MFCVLHYASFCVLHYALFRRPAYVADQDSTPRGALC